MLKKITIIYSLIFSNYLIGQTISYDSLKKIIVTQFPHLDFNQKLLTVSVWNSTDVNSREVNTEMFRVYNIYKEAKLSGGYKGLIFITISSDTDEVQYKIAAQKDLGDYFYTLCDFNSFYDSGLLYKANMDKKNSNIVFDENGKIIYTNLSTQTIFPSFNKLITR